MNLPGIEQTYGAKYRMFAEFCLAMGTSGQCRISSIDKANLVPHLDSVSTVNRVIDSVLFGRFGITYDFGKALEANQSTQMQNPQHGLTMTLSTTRMVTDLIEILDGELTRNDPALEDMPELKEMYGADQWYWIQKDGSNIESRTWNTDDQTIVMMRSQHWGKDYKPALHRAHPRTDDGNPHTGVVAVTAVYGK